MHKKVPPILIKNTDIPTITENYYCKLESGKNKKHKRRHRRVGQSYLMWPESPELLCLECWLWLLSEL